MDLDAFHLDVSELDTLAGMNLNSRLVCFLPAEINCDHGSDEEDELFQASQYGVVKYRILRKGRENEHTMK